MNEKSRERHPLSGKTVIIKSVDNRIDGQKFWVEDWVINLHGNVSWQDMDGNPSALIYALRAGWYNMPVDDEVLYGKIGSYGHMIHESEIGEVTDDPTRYSSYNSPKGKEDE